MNGFAEYDQHDAMGLAALIRAHVMSSAEGLEIASVALPPIVVGQP